MKRIQYYSYGGPETMKLEAFELKAPGTGEVAVKVKFAAINPIDWKLRKGLMKIVTGNVFPRAMGMDFSGTVISVGPPSFGFPSSSVSSSAKRSWLGGSTSSTRQRPWNFSPSGPVMK